MRGIEFVTDVGYGDVLNRLFAGILLDNYEFNISEAEILSDFKLPDISSKIDVRFFERLKMCASYYVLFVNIQAYRKGEKQQKINTYAEFLESACQFIILVADGCYFEIYAKDKQLLMQLIENAITLDAKDIKIKTDYDDGRTRMSVW